MVPIVDITLFGMRTSHKTQRWKIFLKTFFTKVSISPSFNQNVLMKALSVCYEPIFYWTLFVCDFLHIESTLIVSLDVFAYTSTLSAFAFGGKSINFNTFFIVLYFYGICLQTRNLYYNLNHYFFFIHVW